MQTCNKSEKRQWCRNLLTWHHYQFFDIVMFLLWSLVTGPTFMSNFQVQLSWLVLELWQFFFIKDSPEIWKLETICVFPNIWKLLWVRDTEFGTKVSNKMLLNAAKYQGYSFYRFWVILWCLKSKKERARIERRKQPTLH